MRNVEFRVSNFDSYDESLAGFVDGNRAVAGFQSDFGPALLAVFSFEMRIAGFRRGLFQSVRREFRVDITGVTIRDDIEARSARESERDAGVRVRYLDVFLGRGREAHLNVAVAIINLYFAGGILDGHGIPVGAQGDVSRRIDNLQIARAGFHVAGERSQREIRALRDEAKAFGDFVGADGAVKFAVKCEAPRGRRDVNLAALSRDLDIALCVGNFDVTFMHFNGDVAAGVADLDVAACAGDRDRRGHVRNRNVTLLVSHGDGSLLGDLNLQVDADAVVPCPHARGMNFISIAILNNFNGNWAGAALGVGFAPGVHVFLSRDADFGGVRGAHGNLATAAAHGNAGIRGDVYRHDVQVEGIGIPRELNGKIAGYCALGVIDGNNDAQERDHADDQQDFATGNTSRAGIIGAAGDGPLIQLDQSQENERERPPVQQHIAQLQTAVIMKKEEESDS